MKGLWMNKGLIKITKLNTLKDLRGIGYGLPNGFYTDSFMVDSHKLKQEAIKWYKYLDTQYPKEKKLLWWIQDFFNIKDKDLK